VAEENGIVIGLRGGKARIRLERQEACSGCHGLCLFDENSRSMVAEAENALGARVGDRVKIELAGEGAARSGFILYILPLLSFLAGFVAGDAVGRSIGINSEVAGVISGIALVALTYFVIHRWQRRRNRTGRQLMRVVRILGSG
jgi:sigma-E factor negative regulatory protein RseC